MMKLVNIGKMLRCTNNCCIFKSTVLQTGHPMFHAIPVSGFWVGTIRCFLTFGERLVTRYYPPHWSQMRGLAWCGKRQSGLPGWLAVSSEQCDNVFYLLLRSRQMSSSRDTKKPTADYSSQKKGRKCLMCSEEFQSTHYGERVCANCKGTAAWREGQAA